MKLRALFVSVLSFAVMGSVTPAALAAESAGSAPGRLCHHCSQGVPSGIPYLARLAFVTPQATVAAGATVSVTASFANVIFPPTADLTYRGPNGGLTTIALTTGTSPFSITVPAGWKPGRYKLVQVTTSAAASGTQYRNNRLTGRTVDGEFACGRSTLDLKSMDLNVVAR